MVIVFKFVYYMIFFFFFQAEDGIRDIGVTGVQTCALPISSRSPALVRPHAPNGSTSAPLRTSPPRSEERRVGKSVDLGGRRIIKKKKNKDEQMRAITVTDKKKKKITIKIPKKI